VPQDTGVRVLVGPRAAGSRVTIDPTQNLFPALPVLRLLTLDIEMPLSNIAIDDVAGILEEREYCVDIGLVVPVC
jgi:hypothetical protein